MPKIRLNKAIKEFNISMSRLVEFLDSKGIEVENNPNAQLDENAYSALEAEFAKDGEQRKASQEVVLSKVPEEKLEIEEKKPEIIRAKGTLKAETKVLGKIDLNPKQEEPAAPEPAPEVEKAPEPAKEEKQEFKVLGKVNLDEIAGKKPVVKEEIPTAKEEIPVQKKEETVIPPTKEEPAQQVEFETPDKIETVYQKLDGPKILKEKVDLSQFQAKPKSSAGAAKKKRKRIEKPAGQQGGNNNQQGNNQQGNNNQQGGGNRPHNNQGGNRGNNQGGNRGGNQNGGNRGGNNQRGGSRRGADRVMPVELTDEQVKNQIKETLEKLTNKGGKSKASKHRRDKRSYRREQDELQQEREAQDTTLKVTEFITVGELASLMNVSPTEVISACFSLGVMVTMNQRLEADTLLLVADEFG